jgi:hypothetical protein
MREKLRKDDIEKLFIYLLENAAKIFHLFGHSLVVVDCVVNFVLCALAIGNL